MKRKPNGKAFTKAKLTIFVLLDAKWNLR